MDRVQFVFVRVCTVASDHPLLAEVVQLLFLGLELIGESEDLSPQLVVFDRQRTQLMAESLIMRMVTLLES
jgi:hypothetical protein